MINKNKKSELAWYAFDMGNSAHALLISTVGFSIYFKEYLFKSTPEGISLWGSITALVLLISAILSPLLSSFFASKNKRGIGLSLITIVCVISTYLLSTELSNDKIYAIFIYMISAITYYLALPIYNSYLPEISRNRLEKTSGLGWGLGYLGGICSAAICLWLGYLNQDVQSNPDVYKNIFLVAAVFNFILSVPMMIIAYFNKEEKVLETPIQSSNYLNIFKKYRDIPIIRLLFIYWMIGEVAVIISYYFPIYLSEYANLTTKDILQWSILGQIIAVASTIFLGYLASKFNGKKVLNFVIIFWVIIPILLFLITKGLSFKITIIIIGVVIGAFHAIIRGKIAEFSKLIPDPFDRGNLFGFLEVAGRFSQVLGPLLMSFITLFLALKFAILFSIIFPIIALLLTYKLKWQTNNVS